jgi:hypothetical protein
VRHSTGLSGGWAWALGAACSIVGCLNPMPDDFPSRRGPTEQSDVGSTGSDGEPTAPPSSQPVAGQEGDRPEAPRADSDGVPKDDGASNPDGSDAGVPAVNDGGAPADDGQR